VQGKISEATGRNEAKGRRIVLYGIVWCCTALYGVISCYIVVRCCVECRVWRECDVMRCDTLTVVGRRWVLGAGCWVRVL
jgi:hypothetical protein